MVDNMLESQQSDDEDFFKAVPKKGSVVTKKRLLYIGNLSASPELPANLVHILSDRANCRISKSDVAVTVNNNNSKACHAIISCSGKDLDEIIKKLHRTDFEGRRLVVRRERKRREFGGSSPKKHSLGGSSWSKPSRRKDNETNAKSESTEETIQRVVGEEMKESSDPIGTAIVPAAAIGFITSVNPPTGADAGKGEEGNAGFLSQCQQPMSALLSEYGEQDLKWKEVRPDETVVARDKQHLSPHSENRLMKQGKAPIHVEFTSFGYHRGAPAELRNGWCHAQPLQPFDCRDCIEPVPQYLVWRDGLSGAVKRALMNAKPTEADGTLSRSIRQLAEGLAEQVAAALVKAVREGGHGFALPLTMVVFVGSESGRHRSVVLCELAATALRKLLRSNEQSRFGQPCSVGTRHRDIEKRNAQGSNSSSKQKKQRDLEEE